MGLFEHFPYTNFHELNLDWLLVKMKELTEKQTGLSVDIEELRKYVEDTENQLQTQVKAILQGWLNDGTLQEIIANAITPNWLYNKKIVVYGDSTAAIANNYFNIIRTSVQCEITNRAITGTTLTTGSEQNGYTTISNANDLDDFDIIFVCYGTNDWQLGRSLKGQESTNCVEYCTKEIIRTIALKNPNIKIVFILPFYSYHDPDGLYPMVYGELNYIGSALWMYNNEIINVCKKYGVEYIDFYTTSGCNQYNYKYLLDDSDTQYVHENADFSKTLASIVMSRNSNTAPVYEEETSDNLLSYLDFSKEWSSNYSDVSSLNLFANYPQCYLTTNNYTTQCVTRTFIRGEYIISGYCTAPCTVEVYKNNDNSIPFTQRIDRAGYFKTLFKCVDKNFLGYVRFKATTTPCAIGSIGLFYIGRKEVPNIGTYGYAEPLTPNHSSITAVTIEGAIRITKETIEIKTTRFTVSGENIPYGTNIFRTYHTDGVNSRVFLAIKADGSAVYPMIYSGGYIKTISYLPRDTDYIIPDTTINIISNIKI